MSGYTLTWKGGDIRSIDGSALRPDTIGALDHAALGMVELRLGRKTIALGDAFNIEGDPGDTLALRNTPRLDHVGALMRHGTLVIEGDVGDDLGASMSGGLIRVTGHAGHRVGGPHPTSRRGMTGGEILIDGNAGDYAGFLMRRGLIAIGGATGRSVGYRMIAGTIVLAKPPVDHPGLEMQRGTLVCLDGDIDLKRHAHLVAGDVVDGSGMPALLLVLRRLGVLGWGGLSREITRFAKGRWRLCSGDRNEIGKGEILAASSA